MKDLEELLRMIEHPQDYTDEAIQQMLDNPDNLDIREYYELMVAVETGFAQRKQRQSRTVRIWRIAVAIVGVLVLSGIAIAAIHSFSDRTTEQLVETIEVKSESSILQKTESTHQDSIRIYENVLLEEILSDLAYYYHVRVEYQNEQARHIRLYTKWDRSSSLSQIIERLNTFEKICIHQNNNRLIVE